MDDSRLNNPGVVIDNGSGVIKAGFAGKMAPTVTVPSIVGKLKNAQAMTGGQDVSNLSGIKADRMRGLLTLSYPIHQGIVRDWNGMERLWTDIYAELKVQPADHPVLLTEAPLNPRQNRQKMVEVIFESFNVPAAFVSNQALLSLYSSGRTTGCILDSGDGVSYVVPVYEGFCLNHSIKRSDIGGRDITEYLALLLRLNGYIFNTSSEFQIVKNIKETSCSISMTNKDIDYHDKRPNENKYTYKLPDDTEIEIGSERTKAPELLFNPSLIGSEYLGVQYLLAGAISKADMELRKDLANQIVLAGGSTMFSGFVDRFMGEIRRLLPKDSPIKVYAPPERNISTWVGGAILTSLSAFKQVWITKTIYEEEGATAFVRRGL